MLAGLALFPRKVGGRYMMLSRQDGENVYLMVSEDMDVWREKTPLARPSCPWEFVKLGNCGSPIELDEGWLVITHGVGPMRRYCVGAFLLDRSWLSAGSSSSVGTRFAGGTDRIPGGTHLA